MIGFVAFIAVFSSLVFVHEFGHLVAAKLSGVRVDEFGIGFPPRLLTLGSWRGMVISLNLLPIGGFVRLAEEDPAATDSLASKPRRTRAFVHAAGAGRNLLLALALYTVTYSYGTLVPVERPGAGIYVVSPGSPAEVAGLLPGDNIVRIAGVEVRDPQDVVELVSANAGRAVEFVIERNGRELEPMTIVPRDRPPENEGALGVSLGLPFARRSYPIVEAARLGFRATYNSVAAIYEAIASAIRRQMQLPVTGFIGMYSMTSEVAQAGTIQLVSFTAWLSVNLFLLNLLPLPALDGGKLVFVILEWLRGGKRVPPEKEGAVHAVGMVLLLVLMVVITVVDYGRFIG